MDNWTEWTGGDCPAPLARVDIKLRCGKEIKDVPAKDWLWGRSVKAGLEAANDNGGEIVAYRDVMEAA